MATVLTRTRPLSAGSRPGTLRAALGAGPCLREPPSDHVPVTRKQSTTGVARHFQAALAPLGGPAKLAAQTARNVRGARHSCTPSDLRRRSGPCGGDPVCETA